MQERGLMVCRSCAAKGEQSNPGLAEELGIDFTGARIKDTKKRDAFIEWVAAANGLGGKVFPPAIVETPQSQKADIFNRSEKERNICGQTVILKDG
jgi:hypothetical protein